MDPLHSGPVRQAVLRVAVPAALFEFLVFANNFVDYQWVRMLGDEAAAGQTAGWTVFWMLASIGQIFATGATAIVARRIGEGDRDAAARGTTHAAKAAVLAGIVVGAAGWVLVPSLAEINASSPEAAGYTIDYLRTVCAASPLVFCFYALEGTFKGHGDMRRPLRALATALVINIVLDPVLIHVAGLEVLGAALATVIAFGLVTLQLAWSAHGRGWTRWDGPRLDPRLVGRIFRIGTPVSLHGMVFSAVYIFLIRETNIHGGDTATSALGLGLRVEGFAFLMSVGFASAAAAVVGQNLGAGEVRRAHDGAWTAARMAVWISGAWGLVFLVLPAPAVEVLSSSPAATGYALDYFHIVALSLAFTAAEIVLEGAFGGAGDTRPALFLAIPLTVARVPLAMVLARTAGWGVAGVFWAISLSSIVRGLAIMFWFARGRWILGRA